MVKVQKHSLTILLLEIILVYLFLDVNRIINLTYKNI